jgi:hypothetical protein
MPITYYPNGTAKKNKHVVEQLQKPDVLYSSSGGADITSTGLSVSFWTPRSWEVTRVSLNFSANNSKDYSISTVRGLGVVTGLNDRLWFKMDATNPVQILIPQGFYTGATLATALAAAMNVADSGLPVSGKPFVVAYASTTGLFSITSNAGDIELYYTNTRCRVRRESTAAPLIGFTTDAAADNPITSDTAVMGLGTETIIVSGAGSSATNVVVTDVMAMTVDNQILIETSTAPVTANYEIVYRILDP